MGQSWNLSGRTALATLAGLALLEGLGGPAQAVPRFDMTALLPLVAAPGSSARVSVDFVEADLGDIVKALSVQSGVNVAVAAGVKGKVTVRLKGTTLDEALRLISRLANVDYKQINGTYVVGPTDDLRSLAARSGVTQTVAPHYLPLEDAKQIAQSAGPYVLVEARPQSGQLVFRGLSEDVAAARMAVEAADVSSAAPRSTKVLTPTRLRPKQLADLLSKALPEVKCSVQEHSVILTGTQNELVLAKDIVDGAEFASSGSRKTVIYPLKYLNVMQAAELFSPSKQTSGAQPAPSVTTAAATDAPAQPASSMFPHLIVTPGAEVVTPAEPAFKPLSIDSKNNFNSSSGGSSAAATGPAGDAASSKARTLVLFGPEDEVNGAIALLDQMDVAAPQVLIEARVVESSPELDKNVGLEWDFGKYGATLPGGKGVKIGAVSNTGFQFNATLNTLVQNNTAKILAEPKIRVLDGEDASIFIGDTFRYRVLSSITSGGQQVFDVREVPVGIVLLCRPQVNSDGLVTLKVNPVVSTITSFFGPERIPQTASREAKSTIRVKDGETVAIGGLIRDEDRQTLSKVPILGDLPLVGQLFRNNFRQKRKTDVTIFLTTHILKS
jgi:general secretion pathway protein D